MQRNPSESKNHSDLIKMMIQYYTSQGFRNLKADVPNMVSPDIIYGMKKNHIPDITAEKNGVRIILEAETEDSIFDDHTASQWSLFSAAAHQNKGEFHIVVPKGSRSDAEQRAADLGIQVDTIWTPK